MSHVGWPLLLPLSLRLHVAEAILETGQPFESFVDDTLSKLVLDEVATLSVGQLAVAGRDRRAESEADAEGPAVDAYFARVIAELKKRFDARTGESPAAALLISKLQAALDRPFCATCCANTSGQTSTPLPCRWTKASEASDSSTLNDRGLCIRTLKQFFDFAVACAATAYEDAGVQWRPTSLQLATSHDVRNAELDLATNARTTEDEKGGALLRHVHLSFDVLTVGTEDFLSLAYLLVHECVAHGYCGVSVHEADSEDSKPFHEGWMDCVAAYLTREGLEAAQGLLAQLAEPCIRQMDTVRSIRFNTSRQARSSDVTKWIRGETAFHTLEHLFATALSKSGGHGQVGVYGLARERLISFSLQLNASVVDHRARAELCDVINRHYSRTSREKRDQALAKSPQIIDFIEEFFRTGDLTAFLKQVVHIQYT